MLRDRRIIVAYDITDDKRRRKLYKLLKSFGIRTQYSFFECLLSEMQYERLRVGIRKLIEVKEDRVGIMLLCERCHERIERMGYEEPEIFGRTDLVI